MLFRDHKLIEHAPCVRHEGTYFLAKTTQDPQQIIHKIRTLQQVVIEADTILLRWTIKYYAYLSWFFEMVDSCMRNIVNFAILYFKTIIIYIISDILGSTYPEVAVKHKFMRL